MQADEPATMAGSEKGATMNNVLSTTNSRTSLMLTKKISQAYPELGKSYIMVWFQSSVKSSRGSESMKAKSTNLGKEHMFQDCKENRQQLLRQGITDSMERNRNIIKGLSSAQALPFFSRIHTTVRFYTENHTYISCI